MGIFSIHRILLLLLVAGMSSTSFSCPAIDTLSSVTEKDLIIIGGGWAGIGAAYEIERYNSVVETKDKIDYILLEAAGDIGGRAVAAHWISGCERNPVYEFVHELFAYSSNRQLRGGEKGRGKLPSLLIDQQQWSDVDYYCLDPNDSSNAIPCDSTYINEIVRKWAAAYGCVQEVAANMTDNNLTDASLRDTLEKYCEWRNGSEHVLDKGLMANNIEHYDFQLEFVQEPEYTSTKYGLPLGPYHIFQDKDCFISDKGASAVILRELAKERIPNNQTKIFTNRFVCRIDWGDPSRDVNVIACDNDGMNITNCVQYEAPKVISTLSEGVMDFDGDTIFNPKFSSVKEKYPSMPGTERNKLEAMRNVFQTTYAHGAANPDVNEPVQGMTQYKEIKFQFDRKFWAGDYQFIFVETEEDHQCNIWQVYDTKWNNEFFDGSKTLVCVLTTEDYRAFQAKVLLNGGDYNSEVQKLLDNSLGKIYGDLPYWNSYVNGGDKSCKQFLPSFQFDLENPPPTGCQYQLFENDNHLWRGSYVNWKPDTEIFQPREDFDFFVKPLSVNGNNRVHLKGSATCFYHWAYIYGALWSGYDGAQKVIGELRGPSGFLANGFVPSPQYCDVEPQGRGQVRKAKSMP